MTVFTVFLHSINDVKRFVSAANALPCDIDVISGRYIIDAKSIMGMFSLDLSKPVRVELHGTDGDAKQFHDMIAENVVEEQKA